MAKMIFVNLPVTDLARSTAFYEAIGARRNPQFSSDDTGSMVFSDTIVVMIMTHDRFAGFTRRPIGDAQATAQVLLCLSEESRDAVDATAAAAGGAGGTVDPAPPQDYGFMYGRSFADPDGHIWEVMWMDLAAATAAMEQGAGA